MCSSDLPPVRPNQPRIAASDVVPLGRSAEAPRASDQHGAAVAMARAALLPQTGRSTANDASPTPVRTVAIAVPQPAPAQTRDDPPPSLADATVSQAEVDRVVTGSVAPRRPAAEEAPKPTVVASLPARSGWLVQIGAYDQESKAKEALSTTR